MECAGVIICHQSSGVLVLRIKLLATVFNEGQRLRIIVINKSLRTGQCNEAVRVRMNIRCKVSAVGSIRNMRRRTLTRQDDVGQFKSRDWSPQMNASLLTTDERYR